MFFGFFFKPKCCYFNRKTGLNGPSPLTTDPTCSPRSLTYSSPRAGLTIQNESQALLSFYSGNTQAGVFLCLQTQRIFRSLILLIDGSRDDRVREEREFTGEISSLDCGQVRESHALPPSRGFWLLSSRGYSPLAATAWRAERLCDGNVTAFSLCPWQPRASDVTTGPGWRPPLEPTK